MREKERERARGCRVCGIGRGPARCRKRRPEEGRTWKATQAHSCPAAPQGPQAAKKADFLDSGSSQFLFSGRGLPAPSGLIPEPYQPNAPLAPPQPRASIQPSAQPHASPRGYDYPLPGMPTTPVAPVAPYATQPAMECGGQPPNLEPPSLQGAPESQPVLSESVPTTDISSPPIKVCLAAVCMLGCCIAYHHCASSALSWRVCFGFRGDCTNPSVEQTYTGMIEIPGMTTPALQTPHDLLGFFCESSSTFRSNRVRIGAYKSFRHRMTMRMRVGVTKGMPMGSRMGQGMGMQVGHSVVSHVSKAGLQKGRGV